MNEIILPFFIFFLVIYLLSIRRSAKEKQMKELYSEQCGGRFGYISITPPFVRHTLYNNVIMFACGPIRYQLNYNDISHVEVKNGFFNDAIKYNHESKEIPFHLAVSTKNKDEVAIVLRAKGVSL